MIGKQVKKVFQSLAILLRNHFHLLMQLILMNIRFKKLLIYAND